MININDFEDEIDGVILQRGRDYYLDGTVTELDVTGGDVTAEVEGSYAYTVEMSVDSSGSIEASYCSCPYDMGEYCKHEVAVMYALRDYLEEHSINEKGAADLLTLLKGQTADTLAKELYSIAKKDKRLYKRLLFKFDKDLDINESSAEIVNRYIDRVSAYGNVTYDTLDEALEGAYIVLESADKILKKDPIEAAKRYMTVLDIVTELEIYDYDYDGEYYLSYSSDEDEAPQEICDVVDYVTDRFCKLAEVKESGVIFDMVFDKLNGSYESCYYNICEIFCGNKENRSRLERVISAAEDENIRNGLRFNLISRFDGEEKRRRFIEQHINESYYRDIAICEALRNGDCERVLELEAGSGDCGGVSPHKLHIWRKLAQEAAERLGLAEKSKEYLLGFIKDGEFKYIDRFKELSSAEEWENERNGLLEYFQKEKTYYYVDFIKLENMTDRIFDLCRKDPRRILELYTYFKDKYTDEAKELFENTVVKEAAQLRKRRDYAYLSHVIKGFGECFGKECADKIVGILRINHKRQRAFLDELSKI